MIANRRYRVLIGLARCAALLAPWLAGTSCGYPALEPMCGEPEPGKDGFSIIALSAPSCAGLPSTCGAAGAASCCETSKVPGGTFFRGCDRAADTSFKDMDHPATLSPFVLDRYEVTVGRFRAFVAAGMGTLGTAPAPAAGARVAVPNSGWDTSWNSNLSHDTATLVASLKCDAKYQTWTDAAGPNENKPIVCATWYEAMAFCIWDGGYLPTEAEWNFAAGGGSDHRAYPWSAPASSTLLDCGHANYQVSVAPARYCVNNSVGGVSPVGSDAPVGDGRWGHSDLAGNVWEWTLDRYAAAYEEPCVDCASVTADVGAARVLRGGSFFNEDLSLLRAGYRLMRPPDTRTSNYGVRCARP